MKRILILAAAAMGLLVASCQKVELVDNSAVENVKAYTHYLTATVEDNAETRVAFDENGAFYWNEDDVIGVVDIIDDTTSVFTEMFIEEDTTRVGTAKVRFGGELIGEMGHYTAYPYNAAHAIEGDVLTYNLPESYSVVVGENGQQINTNAAMWAKIEDGNATFKHLGGFFKIYVLNLPSSGTLTVSTFDKKLTGNFETDLTDETPVIETAEFDPYAAPSVDEEEDFTPADGNTVTVDFVVDSEDVVTEGVFYIPAPLGTYSYVQVSVTSSDPVNYFDVTTERTFTDVTIKRCTPAAGTITVTTAESQLQSSLDYYDQVNLTESISLTAPLTISKAVTLDLNGQTLSAGTFKLNNDGSYEYGDSHSVAFLIKDGGKLTIIDSSEDTTEYFESASGQVVAADAANSHVAIVEDGGELIIKAGNFSNRNNPANGDGNALIVNNGDLFIYGGVFEPCYDYNAASEFSEASYSPAYSGNGNNVIKGGEYKGFKPANNAIGIEEVTVYPSASFGEDGDIEFEFDPQVVTRYMVSFEKNNTFVAALSAFDNVPLTEDLTFTEPIKVSTYVTLNLRESVLTGQIINENGALTIESGVNGQIVNPNGSTIKTVGVETPQTKATVTVPSATIDGLHGGLASTSINGGTFIGGANSPAVEAHNNSTLNITAGRFEGLYGILTNGSVINVSGAEFDATNGIYVENSNVTYQNCNFNDVTDADVVLGNNNTESNINESNVKDGGDYEITPDLVTKFFTEGGSLTLTEDTNIGGSIELTEYMTLDLGGNTLELSNVAVTGYVTIINGTLKADKIDVAATGSLTFTDVVYTGTNEMTVKGEMNVTGGALDTAINVDDNELTLTDVDVADFGRISTTENGQIIVSCSNSNDIQSVFDADNNLNINITFNITEKLSGDIKLGQNGSGNVIINGNGNEFAGTISIDGEGNDSIEESLTINDLIFVTDSEQSFITTMNKAHNIEISGCSFTGAKDVNNCALNLTDSYDITIKDCTVYNSNGGLSLGTSSNVTIENTAITATTYGVRADGTTTATLTIKDSEIEADMPVVVRYMTANGYNVVLDSVELSTEEKFEVIFTNGIDDLTKLAIPTGNFTITSDEGYDVYPNEIEIASAEQLVAAFKEAAIITLTGDIDLSNTSWTPVGTSEVPFSGIFDGNNHKIKNLTISDTDYAAFIAYTGENTTVKNISFENINIKSTKHAAGVVCIANADGLRLENISVDGRIDAASYAGGIVHNAGNVIIKNCTNSATISASRAGGIASWVTVGANLESVSNEGTITGIVGASGIAHGFAGSIKKAVNYGTITSKGPEPAAGIVGVQKGASKYEYCFNHGIVSSTEDNPNASAAGILGQTPGTAATLNYCANYGKVVAEQSYAAGIAYSLYGSVNATYCYNEGYISGGDGAGAIAPKAQYGNGDKANYSLNSGEVHSSKGTCYQGSNNNNNCYYYSDNDKLYNVTSQTVANPDEVLKSLNSGSDSTFFIMDNGKITVNMKNHL